MAGRASLFDVAESSDTTQSPVVWVLRGAQQQERDVVEVGAVRLLVDRTLVELGIARTGLDRVHVDDRQRREEHFVVRLHHPPRTPVPRRSVEKQAVDVHTLLNTIHATALDYKPRYRSDN